MQHNALNHALLVLGVVHLCSHLIWWSRARAHVQRMHLRVASQAHGKSKMLGASWARYFVDARHELLTQTPLAMPDASMLASSAHVKGG